MMRIILFIFSLFLFAIAYAEGVAITINNFQLQAVTIPEISEVQSLISTNAASDTNKVVDLVIKTIENTRSNHYKLGGTHFDLLHGKYNIDCSSYVNDLLKSVSPAAYSTLASTTGTTHPTTEHYYEFFRQLSTTANRYWNNVKNVSQLQPGDILVFRFKKSSHSAEKGHIMVVMDQPVQQSESYLVRVADSAPFAHSEDSRASQHTSGIGVGTMVLKTDPTTGKLSSYAWKVGAPFRNNVHFEMARPIEV